ncbi:hypothetical protein N9Y92_00545 [Chlamydiales bacterium]|nr:hypothetical protein [Chlamydiales bacterium]
MNNYLEDLKESLLISGFDKVLIGSTGANLFCLGKGNPKPFGGVKIQVINPVGRSLKQWYLNEIL